MYSILIYSNSNKQALSLLSRVKYEEIKKKKKRKGGR